MLGRVTAPKDPSPNLPSEWPASADPDDEDRQAILARRSRFVASALAGLAGASLVAACSGSEANPQPCLSGPFTPTASTPTATAMPTPCLSPIPPDSGPGDAGTDASSDAEPGADAGRDAGPFPCLIPPLRDSGSD